MHNLRWTLSGVSICATEELLAAGASKRCAGLSCVRLAVEKYRDD